MPPKGKTVVKPIGRSNGSSAKPSTSSSKPIASSSKTASSKSAASANGAVGLRQPGQAAGRAVPPAEPKSLDSSRRVPEYRSDDDVCPVCKSDRFLNPRLRLLVSRCYHRMCESCIDRIFTLGPEPCPICGQIVRKNTFAAQTFENLRVQKEVGIRRRVADIFNKREDEFTNLKDYNDYLETVENITFNLINSIDVAETEARIKRYKAENAALIEANASRSQDEAIRQAERDEADRNLRERQRQVKRKYADLVDEARADGEREIADALAGGADADATEKAIEQLRVKQAAAIEALERAETEELDKLTIDLNAGLPDDYLRLVSNAAGHAAAAKLASDTEPPLDPLADLRLYDDYHALFTLPGEDPSAGGGYEYDPFTDGLDALAAVGGFTKTDVWERYVRSAVMELF